MQEHCGHLLRDSTKSQTQEEWFNPPGAGAQWSPDLCCVLWTKATASWMFQWQHQIWAVSLYSEDVPPADCSYDLAEAWRTRLLALISTPLRTKMRLKEQWMGEGEVCQCLSSLSQSPPDFYPLICPAICHLYCAKAQHNILLFPEKDSSICFPQRGTFVIVMCLFFSFFF